MLAGSKRYPWASPTIFTSCVVPVIGAIVAVPPAAGVSSGSGAAAAAVVSIRNGSRIAGILVTAGASAENNCARCERNSVKPHFLEASSAELDYNWLRFPARRRLPREIVNLFTKPREINEHGAPCVRNRARNPRTG